MKNLTLKQFRYFDALAQLGHFGRAAETCSISQPALSMQIKEMEASLGTILFDRGTKQIRLTNFGLELRDRVRNILRAVDDLEDLARASSARLAGQLRIGLIPTIAPYLLPSIIADLAKQSPEIDLHIRETLTQSLIQELADGRIDTAIVALPVSEPSLVELELFSEDFVLVRPKTDESKPVPNIETLHKMRLLLLEEGHCFREQALSFCRMKSAKPREGLDGSSLSTLVQLVGAGIGITLLPQMAVDVETKSAPVSIGEFDHPKPSRKIGMIWRKSSPLDPQLRGIAGLVENAGKKLRDQHGF